MNRYQRKQRFTNQSARTDKSILSDSCGNFKNFWRILKWTNF
nr:MAG TPA: hypothetical protein [Caudoviricetes sp.]